MDENIDDILDEENRLKNYHGPDECILSVDLLHIFNEREKQAPSVALKSGIPKLDFLLHRFSGGELVTISGPTKMGKTLFAQTLTRNFLRDGHGSLWFTYEVPPHQFLKQFGEEPPLFVMPKQLTSHMLTWLKERIWEAILKFGVKAVFIDNTHNLLNISVQNLSNQVGELLKFLKAMAIEFDIVIFLLHHLVKGKLDSGEEIGSHLLRDSSMVAQTSDTVMFIWREKDTVNRSTVKITENRAFGVMNQYVDLIKIGNFLEEAML